ncbi:MAG TPA: DNA repair protein RadA, partial [Desulfosporosinus sp.]|nr:DNA repair protein RadA [Desulfosporosinus sp.]
MGGYMKTKVIYRCSNCGSESPKWLGKCQSCEEWNTFEESESQPKTMSSPSKRKTSPKRLSEVLAGNSDRIVTSISE